MKRFGTKILGICSILVSVIFLLNTCAFDVNDYRPEYIEFGSFPQGQVTDNQTLQLLNGSDAQWVSCTYADGIRYADVKLNGKKYRGVIIESYRSPYCYGSSEPQLFEQQRNGYHAGIIFWFSYEPIVWRVLDPKNGILISESILDSEPFNSDITYNDANGDGDISLNDEMLTENGDGAYANNYVYSSIRDWLNTEFIHCAFSTQEASVLKVHRFRTNPIDTKGKVYASEKCEDKVWLLSDDEANAYFLSEDRSSRKAYGTAYAKCMGLWTNTGGNNAGASWWWLRTPGYTSVDALSVASSGLLGNPDFNHYSVDSSFGGVRPVLKVAKDYLKKAARITTDRIATSNITGNADDDKRDGQYIYFGNYPQTQVTDEELIEKLKLQPANYKSYQFSDGENKLSDFMRYADVAYKGEKYRAVVFSKYRMISPERTDTNQSVYGYLPNTVYWFKYEPIKWRVLDKQKGLLLSEYIITGMAVNEYLYKAEKENDTLYFSDEECKNYASDYAHSTIREWLNTDFYNTAFSNTEKPCIELTYLDNSAFSTGFSRFNSKKTKDKVFLLSYKDLLNHDYGFSPEKFHADTARITYSTDYAKCMGIWTSGTYQEIEGDHDGASWWWLRSPSGHTELVCAVSHMGILPEGFEGYSVNYIDSGIRPAIHIIRNSS